MISGKAPGSECERVGRLLPLYADGEAERSESLAIQAHLAVCPRCAAREQFERRLQNLVRSLGHAPVPTTLSARVRAVVNTTEQSNS